MQYNMYRLLTELHISCNRKAYATHILRFETNSNQYTTHIIPVQEFNKLANFVMQIY